METTLRTRTTFEQARLAHEHGFRLEMIFLALERVEDNIERIAMRADSGGHATSVDRIRAIRRASLANLGETIRVFDRIWIYDNSELGSPRLIMETESGAVRMKAERIPKWLGQIVKDRPPLG